MKWLEYRLGRVKHCYEMYCNLVNKTEGLCVIPILKIKLEKLLNLDIADGFKDSKDLYKRVTHWIRKTERRLREKQKKELKEELERYAEKGMR